MMKINFRPLFIGFVSLIVGIVIFTRVYSEINVINIVLLTLYLIINLIFVIGFILSFIKTDNKIINYAKKFKRVCLTLIIFCCASLMVTSILYLNFNNTTSNTEVNVEAKISEEKVYSRYAVIELSDVKFNGEKINGKLELSFTFGDNANISDFREGNFVNFKSVITATKFSTENMKLMNNNVKYSCNTSVTDVNIINGNSSFKTIIKNGILNNLNTVLNSENSALAYSMLFGEKNDLSEQVYNAFSFSGLAHILAVSGLHIGFLVSFLVLLLNLIKCNKHLKIFIIFVILLFYAYLTNFTPSVLRAFIMSMVLLLSKTYNKEYDALSSLSLAGVIILIIKPTELFSIGFQLSFACVFSIITIANGIKSILLKIKCPKILAESLGISIAVNLGVLAITAVHFKNLNFISVFSNIVVLPMFSVCYVMLFLFGILAFIPFFNYLLFIPNIILHFIKMFANLFADINFLNFEIFHMSYVIVFLSLLTLYIAKFLISEFNLKTMLCSGLIIITLVLSVITNLPVDYNSYKLMMNYSRYGNIALFTTEENYKVLVVNSLMDSAKVNDLLKTNYVSKLNAIVSFGFSPKETDGLIEVIKKFNVDDLYINNEFENNILDNFSKFVNVKFRSDQFNVNNINFELLNVNSANVAINLNINNKSILMLADKISKQELFALSFQLDENVDFLISNNNNFNFYELNIFADEYILYRETKQTEKVTCLLNELTFTKQL